MSEAVVVLGDVTYVGDAAARSITPVDDRSALALTLMSDNDLCGPQVDEWAGLRSGWESYPRSMVGVFFDIADADDTQVTWFSTTGQRPPEDAAQEA